jgi:hypothetical protein
VRIGLGVMNVAPPTGSSTAVTNPSTFVQKEAAPALIRAVVREATKTDSITSFAVSAKLIASKNSFVVSAAPPPDTCRKSV